MESELQGEQEFVDMAYARLDAMRSDANSMLEGVLDLGRGGTFQSRTERDVIVRTSMARLEQLDIGDQALTFGRIDRLHEGHNGDARDLNETETFHIGRLAIHSADHDPLVVDWRAPLPNRSTGPPAGTRRGWSFAGTWPSTAAGWWGWRTSASGCRAPRPTATGITSVTVTLTVTATPAVSSS